MNPDMHFECADISTCTQPLAKREHLITLEIISTSTATQREPSASGTEVLGWTTAGRAQESRLSRDAGTPEVITDRVHDKNEKTFTAAEIS